MLILPLQPDRELPCRRNHLQGPLLLYRITSRINSMGRVLTKPTHIIGTRPRHLSSNWFLARHLQYAVRTIPTTFRSPKSVWTIPFNSQHPKPMVWTIPFHKQHPKSIVQTNPNNRQLPKSIVWAIPVSGQHPKSSVRTIPIVGPAPEINILNNSN